MIIRVHTSHGKVFEFTQKDEVEGGGILGSVVPHRFFGQQQVIIQGRSATSGFATAAIEAVEFETPVEIAWAPKGHDGALTLVDRDTFAAELESRKRRGANVRRRHEPGERAFTQAELVMRSDERFFLHQSVLVAGPLDTRHEIHSFFETKSIIALLPQGGAMIINPSNIVRWTLYPGPVDSPRNAWHASRTQ